MNSVRGSKKSPLAWTKAPLNLRMDDWPSSQVRLLTSTVELANANADINRTPTKYCKNIAPLLFAATRLKRNERFFRKQPRKVISPIVIDLNEQLFLSLIMKPRWIYHSPDSFLHLDFFINPIPGTAVLLMAINDHFLKYAYPSVITGKLSDFLGMFYFPLLMCAGVCLMQNFWRQTVSGKREIAYITRKKLVFSSLFAVFLLVATKCFSQMDIWIADISAQLDFPMKLVNDPTDLIAITSVFATYAYAKSFFDNPPTAYR